MQDISCSGDFATQWVGWKNQLQDLLFLGVLLHLHGVLHLHGARTSSMDSLDTQVTEQQEQ